jgi:hypothetical protein
LALRRWVLPAALAALAQTGGAAASGVPVDWPGPIQACLAGGTCAVSAGSVFEAGGTSAFLFHEGGPLAYLVRYALWPTSGLTDSTSRVEEDPDTGELVVVTARREERFGGAAWLRVQAAYSSAEPVHRVTLYLDRVTPDAEPLPRWGTPGELFPYTLELGLTNSALLAGGAYRAMALDSGYSGGDLEAAQPLLPCLADGCAVAQRLNLVRLTFAEVGADLRLAFNAADPRALLYREHSRYTEVDGGFDSTRSLLAQAPLPAAFALFAPALALLGWTTRRRPARSDQGGGPAGHPGSAAGQATPSRTGLPGRAGGGGQRRRPQPPPPSARRGRFSVTRS